MHIIVAPPVGEYAKVASQFGRLWDPHASTQPCSILFRHVWEEIHKRFTEVNFLT